MGELVNNIDEVVQDYKLSREENGVKTNMLDLLHLIDHLFNKANPEIKRLISCRRGCSFCCRIHVHISDDEAELLVAAAESANVEIDWEYLKIQAPLDERDQMLHPTHANCVFLDAEKGECKVYDARPTACRKYLVVSDPKDCDAKTNVHGGVKTYFDYATELLASAMFNTGQASGSMAEMLLKHKK